jgi:hypothetical protein
MARIAHRNNSRELQLSYNRFASRVNPELTYRRTVHNTHKTNTNQDPNGVAATDDCRRQPNHRLRRPVRCAKDPAAADAAQHLATRRNGWCGLSFADVGTRRHLESVNPYHRAIVWWTPWATIPTHGNAIATIV